jgi:hypothetical protein
MASRGTSRALPSLDLPRLRRREFATLQAHYEEGCAEAGNGCTIVITGAAGTDKTALATALVRWSLRDRRVPGGQLAPFVANLSDPSMTDATTVHTVLTAWLPTLRVREIPVDLGGRIALFRSKVGARRATLLLDGVRSFAQVYRLLALRPRLLVATSRIRLPGLVNAGARELRVLPRPAADAAVVSAQPGGAGR